MRLRPEQLGQMISENDLDEFEDQISIGRDRSRKVLDAFRTSIDPLALEIIEVEDRVCIELNVASGAGKLDTTAEPNFKDAAHLSRGQKCTSLLPLLLVTCSLKESSI